MSEMVNTQNQNDDEIDLMQLVGSVWDGRWIIVAVTFAFTVLGVGYALIQTPIYKADALIQVEKKKGGVAGMADLAGIMGEASSSSAEIELIKSRRVLGAVVEKLNLDVQATPHFFPVFGPAVARRFNGLPGELAHPLFGEKYAWGGESIAVSHFDVPEGMKGKAHTLMATDSGWELLDPSNQKVLEGKVGNAAHNGDYSLMVVKLTARPGTEFFVTKQPVYNAVQNLISSVEASEKGIDTGMISLNLEDPDPDRAKRILNAIGEYYVRQNVERSSAEAAQSLEFMRRKLPDVKRDLELAEQKLNEYKVTAETIDIGAEGAALLNQVVALEKQISEMEIQRVEIEQKFQPTHPRYKAWLLQVDELKSRRSELDSRISELPETQQELVRLNRDVEVGNEIYLQMLANIQQLDIARAGTVGNVRVVDDAAVNVEQPVRPKKPLIVALAFVLGGMVGVFSVLVRNMLNRGVENPDEIENIGLPVYTGVPQSETQETFDRNRRRAKQLKKASKARLLAVENPADLAIESIRSLRTSLHFGMMDAKNNILMISGPSPNVGKTFVSTNLAAVMALTEQKVLLVDADLRKGTSHQAFGVDNKSGLSDVLSGTVTLEEAINDTDVPSLKFISRGTVPPNPSELLMSRQFEEFIKQVSPDYDLVIIDTPPILAVTDPAIVGKHAGTTMLVTRFGVNPVKEIELTKRRFEQNGIEVKGVIFNAVVKKASSYGGYGYGYYNYEYKSEKA